MSDELLYTLKKIGHTLDKIEYRYATAQRREDYKRFAEIHERLKELDGHYTSSNNIYDMLKKELKEIEERLRANNYDFRGR